MQSTGSSNSIESINARDDRIQTAPTYRELFKKRRCLVPASGWYEWQKVDAKTKRPHFQPVSQALRLCRCMGWDVWKGDGKEPITSFSIVTTSPAPSTAQCHDRMPVVLEECKFADWMRGPPELAAEMMNLGMARSTSGKWARMSATCATTGPSCWIA